MNDTAPRPALPAVQVRNSRDDDLPGIQAIYAHHVLHGTGTFEIDPPSLEDMTRRRADVLGNRFPWLVAERDGVLLGYAYANHFRTRPAYRFTVEDSIYIAPQAVGQGVGRLADGLQAIAHADDGLVEAFQVKNAPGFTLGVQWHPEWRCHENPFYSAIFNAFSQAMQERRRDRLR